jgi:pantoate--beta-alanine ligase
MQILRTCAEMRDFSRANPSRTGFVPTMGYLHEGHGTLIQQARAENDRVVVSIFVNPAQFNDPADFEKYPIDLDRDFDMLRRGGVDAVFCPRTSEVYPAGVPTLKLRYDDLMSELCGRYRHGHFEGVLLIVHNLLLWVNPSRAYFGLKDFQQYVLVKHMVRDLSLTVEIVGCEIIRESDGLAMSSRNVRLSAEGRAKASGIYQALIRARDAYRRGLDPVSVRGELLAALVGFDMEYGEVVDVDTLRQPEEFEREFGAYRAAVACYIDGVRLIDNILFES